ncbi:methyl-accepting chemotaxis sensory transducer with Cache sensor [Paucimonas lemoignei]|uniref:Methyl-accepting chemotaxis sensory transducer with Cache sensor n=1 Tax=Paucimonas lemoignei TaxID=29443 RepID=A0A4R3HYL5_PAULE|nr:methyl-accepting chemotaxis protein [Paucimonas lemoignei]TCS37954.1 methyl-accepting chemotaxis sensory transducer with Cache sensor [Paucimonas lemoignei]
MKLAFRTKLFLPLLLSWICLLGVMTVNVMQNRSIRLEERRIQLSNAAEMALSVAKEYADKISTDGMSQADAQKEALARIKALRFGESGYIVVINSGGALMHPINAALIGKPVDTVKDPRGTLIYGDALKVVKEKGAGFTEYVWTKPGDTKQITKLSYNLGYAPWDWTFMTGLYIDDLDKAFYDDLLQAAAILMALGIVLTGVVLLNIRSIEKSIGGDPEYAKQLAERIAQGDLAMTVKLKTNDAGSMVLSMKTMQDRLASVIGTIHASANEIATASQEVSKGNLDLSARTEHQASSLEETASSMEELTSTVRQSADNARQANGLALSASDVARKGGTVMSQVVDTMGDIQHSAGKIAEIISVIDGIAFQTNILALNAAVEAARAGEQGRGFAVVAAEVRTLAQRSANAAKEIKTLIESSVEKAATGAKLVGQAGTTMDEIEESVKRVTDIMGEISSAAQEQNSGIEQVNQAIMQMDQVTQQNAALVEQLAAASAAMQEQSKELAHAVSVFKLGDMQRTAALPAAPANRLQLR